MNTTVDELMIQVGKKNMVSTKKTKRVPVSEQYGNMQEACRNVVSHLKRKGINIPETSIKTIGDGLPDSKTGPGPKRYHGPDP